MGSVKLTTPRGVWLQSARERAKSCMAGMMGWPSSRANDVAIQRSLEKLALASDFHLDDVGLTRAELETLIRDNAASRTRLRNRWHMRKPLFARSIPDGQGSLTPMDRSASGSPKRDLA
jgi:hypothetical protein